MPDNTSFLSSYKENTVFSCISERMDEPSKIGGGGRWLEGKGCKK
jgi:hypothetical protein